MKYFLKNGKNIFINEKVTKNAKIEGNNIFELIKWLNWEKTFF